MKDFTNKLKERFFSAAAIVMGHVVRARAEKAQEEPTNPTTQIDKPSTDSSGLAANLFGHYDRAKTWLGKMGALQSLYDLALSAPETSRDVLRFLRARYRQLEAYERARSYARYVYKYPKAKRVKDMLDGYIQNLKVWAEMQPQRHTPKVFEPKGTVVTPPSNEPKGPL